MTNDWKRTFQHCSVLVLLALSIVAVIGLSPHVKLAAAQGGCSVFVGEDGATCNNSGNTHADGSGDGSNGSDSDGDGSNHNGGGSGVNNSGGGSNNNGNGVGDDDSNGGGGGSCSPGTVTSGTITVQAGSTGLVTSDGSVIPVGSYQLPGGTWVPAGEVPPNMCFTSAATVDSCTGEVYSSQLNSNLMLGAMVSECPTSNNPLPPNPCDEFTVNTGGVTCTTDFVDSSSFPGSEWQLTVHTPFPGAEIHTRPYPVTLANWDTVMRVMGLGSSSKTGHLGYAAWGGGSESSPAMGDWRDVTLRLEIKPVADWADVFLENIGLVRMRLGELHTFQWNLPSHPAAGGGPLSGQVGQLEELEPDVPLYTNWTRAPYLVYCTISYYEWKSTCVGGAGDNGELNCRKDSNGNFTGHREWGWKRQSKTTVITPDMAINQVPAGMLADLNGDGKPDAYWGRLSFIRRMDDARNVNNPQWAHSYSWGPVWYWAVREGQGQIGWPGVPVP